MDKYNRFFTPTLYRMIRTDWAILMLATMIAAALHWREINWWIFMAMFWWIDILGTFPGTFLQKKKPDRKVPEWCILLYNFCHSFTTVGVITAAWYALYGPAWEMLAMPMHLAADRSIFGNIYKRIDPKFEPGPHPAFLRFDEDFRRAQQVARSEQ